MKSGIRLAIKVSLEGFACFGSGGLMIFRQLFDQATSTYTYILADENRLEAVLIDPVDTMVGRDLKLIQELGLKLKFIFETHIHADHITGANLLREQTDAEVVVPDETVRCADRVLIDGEIFQFGDKKIQAISTPGHTVSCTSYVVEEEGLVFTGDTLFIRGTGRTDFQGGSAIALYKSINERLLSLPDSFKVYPGHDYKGMTVSTIGEERLFNPRIAGKSEAEFLEIMQNLGLPMPKRIHEALPANQVCGMKLKRADPQGLEVEAAWVSQDPKIEIIDVRGPDEYHGENGHIPNSRLIPLDTLADSARSWRRHDRLIVVNCHSGRRSLTAVKILRDLGFHRTYSLKGGILDWVAKGHPVKRN